MAKMSEEKKIILRMLKEGKISEEEALKLLESVKDDKKFKKEDFKFDTNEFVDKITQAAIKLGEKSQEVISSLNFEDFSLDDFNLNFRSSSNKNTEAERIVTETAKDLENPKLVIENRNGKIRVYAWDNEEVEARATVAYDDKYISSNYNFITIEKDEEEDLIKIAPDYERSSPRHFNMNVTVAVPKDIFQSISLNSTNSNIKVEDIATEKLLIESTNAKINLENIDIEMAEIKSANGKISGENLKGKSIIIDTSNGKINLKDLDYTNVDLNTINGNLTLDNIKESVEEIKASTYNGNIYISLKDVYKPVKAKVLNHFKDLDTSNFNDSVFTNFVTEDGSMIAYTDNYEESEENLDITASTHMGAIKIK